MHRRRYTLALAAALAPLLNPVWAGAQGEPPPPPPDAPAQGEEDAAHLRARLTGILEHLESSAAKVRAAIARIDEGAGVDEAVEELGGPLMVRRFADVWERWNVVRADTWRAPPGPGERWQPEPPRRYETEEVIAFLREHAPELTERIEAVRSENPRGAEGYLERLTPRISEILSAREHDPRLAEILTREFQVWMKLLEAAGGYAKAKRDGDSERADRAQADIRALAAEQVDLRLDRRKHEVAVLGERVDALRGDIERQQDEREQLIEELVERMTSERWRREDGEERRRRRGDRD